MKLYKQDIPVLALSTACAVTLGGLLGVANHLSGGSVAILISSLAVAMIWAGYFIGTSDSEEE